MMNIYDQQKIALAAARLADCLPEKVMIAVAGAVLQHGGRDRAAARLAILQSAPTADFRDAAGDFLDVWFDHAPGSGPEPVAAALVTAAVSQEKHQQDERVELVWTGPESDGSHFRQTEQALLEVIDSAMERLTVVSYAVYKIPRIRQALVAAASRGVVIRLIVETSNRIEGKGAYDSMIALGSSVASVCSVYFWPQEKRLMDQNGKVGSLHVKCAVADGRWMFLSSANLTEYAFTLNMELGVLIGGGMLPEEVEGHFDGLIKSMDLEAV